MRILGQQWFSIDEPAIYNQALTAQDIQAIYDAGASGKCKRPIIYNQPQHEEGCLAHSATFSVLALGSEPLNYQWLFNFGAMNAQTNRSLVLTNLQRSHEGLYSVVVSNSYGSVTSAPAQLLAFDACMDIHMYAGLTIAGQQGSNYVLKYTTDLNNTNFATWTRLATNTMGSSNWFYLDMESPFSPKRFYGVKLLP